MDNEREKKRRIYIKKREFSFMIIPCVFFINVALLAKVYLLVFLLFQQIILLHTKNYNFTIVINYPVHIISS